MKEHPHEDRTIAKAFAQGYAEGFNARSVLHGHPRMPCDCCRSPFQYACCHWPDFLSDSSRFVKILHSKVAVVALATRRAESGIPRSLRESSPPAGRSEPRRTDPAPTSDKDCPPIRTDRSEAARPIAARATGW